MNPFESGAYQQLVHLEKQDTTREEFSSSFTETWDELVQEMEKIGGRYAGNGEEEIFRFARNSPGMIVRRETPKVFMDAMSKKQSLKIRFDPAAHGGQAYPNAGILGEDAYGLRIPYQRGFGKIDEAEGGKGKIVCIIGFVPGTSIRSKSIPINEYPHYKNGRERGLIRMVEGDVAATDVRFVLFRIPAAHVPEEFLTDRELEQEQKFISRVFVFNEETFH